MEDRVEKYNLSEILKFANLQHIVLQEEDRKKYLDFLDTRSRIKPAKSEQDDAIPTEEDFANNDKEGFLKEVSYAEKCAINIWTGKAYESMQYLLTNRISKISDKGDDVLDTLVHSVMACSGLNKVQGFIIHHTFRWESAHSKATLNRNADRISATEKGGDVIMESAFVSTAYKKPSHVFFTPGKTNVGIFYTDGIIGKNIVSVSQHPDEREFLIPPTQVVVEGRIRETGIDYFKCRTVRTLTNLPREALALASSIKDEETFNYIVQFEHIQRYVVDLLGELRRHKYNPDFIEKIMKLNNITEALIKDSKTKPIDKLIHFEREIQSTIQEIERSPVLSDIKEQTKKITLLEMIQSEKHHISKQVWHINLNP